MPKGRKSEIDKKLNYPEFLIAPIVQGSIVGELIIRVDGKEVDKIDLIAKTTIEKSNLGNILKKTWKSFLLNK